MSQSTNKYNIKVESAMAGECDGECLSRYKGTIVLDEFPIEWQHDDYYTRNGFRRTRWVKPAGWENVPRGSNGSVDCPMQYFRIKSKNWRKRKDAHEIREAIKESLREWRANGGRPEDGYPGRKGRKHSGIG